jgi:hypothetical protein
MDLVKEREAAEQQLANTKAQIERLTIQQHQLEGIIIAVAGLKVIQDKEAETAKQLASLEWFSTLTLAESPPE